jgi:hypothetical protein
LPSNRKQQIEEYLEGVRVSEEYKDPGFKKVVDENTARLLELADKEDAGDDSVLPEIITILESVDNVLTGVHEKVTAAMKGKNEFYPKKNVETVGIAELLRKLEESYDNTVETLKDFGFTDRLPSKKRVMSDVKSLGLDMLEKISKFNKPIVVITPKGTFADKIDAINAHKIMPGQTDVFFDEDNCLPKNHEIWGPPKTKMIVSIVDGIETMPPAEFIAGAMNSYQRVEKYREEYRKDGFELVTPQEYAIMMMKSLKNGPLLDVMDFNFGETVDPEGAYTALDYQHSTDNLLPVAYWELNSEIKDGIDFMGAHILDGSDYLRCRPSVQVLEYDESVNSPEAEKEQKLTPEQKEKLLKTLRARFNANMNRHPDILWENVFWRLDGTTPEKFWSLHGMERTGGEPDVVGLDDTTGEFIFIDCSEESPSGRRNCVYDTEAEEEVIKKGETCNGNAVDMAKEMGIELLTEEQWRGLQKLGEFDTHSYSWIKIPFDIRKTEKAVSAYRRLVGLFVGPCFADIHSDEKGFRGSLRV